MKRKVRVTLNATVADSPFSGRELLVSIYKKFSNELYLDNIGYHIGLDVCPINWSVAEVTSHKDVADAVAREISDWFDSNVFAVCHDDNDTQDIGYELISKGKVLCNICITKIDNFWTVFIKNGSQNREITSVNDIIDYLGLKPTCSPTHQPTCTSTH